MQPDSLTFIFLNTVLANNFVLAMFLGLCPFLGVSGKLNTAIPMGIATMFVMLVSSLCAFAINKVLVALDIEFLRLIAYIAIIASAVQLVEMGLKKYSPSLFRSLGIFLPLITTNCAILGLALFQTFKHGLDFICHESRAVFISLPVYRNNSPVKVDVLPFQPEYLAGP